MLKVEEQNTNNRAKALLMQVYEMAVLEQFLENDNTNTQVMKEKNATQYGRSIARFCDTFDIFYIHILCFIKIKPRIFLFYIIFYPANHGWLTWRLMC